MRKKIRGCQKIDNPLLLFGYFKNSMFFETLRKLISAFSDIFLYIFKESCNHYYHDNSDWEC